MGPVSYQQEGKAVITLNHTKYNENIPTLSDNDMDSEDEEVNKSIKVEQLCEPVQLNLHKPVIESSELSEFDNDSIKKTNKEKA